MNSSEINISPFKDSDYARLSELTSSTYKGHEIADERYLFWEYRMNPHGNAIMHVAEHEGKLVSQYVVIPRLFNYSGRTLRGSVSLNTVTHPAYRGMNLFPKLSSATFSQCSREGILFTIGFPNPVSLPVIRRKRIFDVAGSLSLVVKPLNPVRSAIRFIRERKEKRGDEIPLKIHEFSNADVASFDIISSSASYNSMLKNFNLINQLTTHRDVDFFKWRYKEIPRRTYHAVSHGKDPMNGLVIYRAKNIYGLRCLVIVDMICIEMNALKELLREINLIARENNIELIVSAMPSHSAEFAAFKSAGFFSLPDIVLPQKLVLIIKKHQDCPEDVMNFENWYLTFGDYDIF